MLSGSGDPSEVVLKVPESEASVPVPDQECMLPWAELVDAVGSDAEVGTELADSVVVVSAGIEAVL